MRFTDRMLAERKKQNALEKKKNDVQQDAEEDDVGMAYMERPRWGYLNTNKGVFAGDDDDSINTARSVFDRLAVFHTDTGDRRED